MSSNYTFLNAVTLNRMKLQKRATTLCSFTRVPNNPERHQLTQQSTVNTQRQVIINVFNLIISLPFGGISDH
ncbi:hypothetical protein BPOR_0281g00020 [Botrytis porri]|uniref:Uncharacterized protein n=1 Tax=Botrytis porri TaxID=87229 RepID=A0A4Z1KT03_9HELO|nr:hypothetical protein BPOR_0281g00020 [Botrytis porri]